MTDPGTQSDTAEHQRLVAGFNVYRVPAGAALPAPSVFTCFRGVPVASEASVEGVGDYTVMFGVTPSQIHALSCGDFALIKSPLHGMTFQARATALDADGGLASFCGFERHDVGADRRASVRHEPEAQVEMVMRLGVETISGQLLDVSVDALAVQLRCRDASILRESGDVGVSFVLPRCSAQGAVPVDVSGVLARVLPPLQDAPRDSYRVVVKTNADGILRDRLESYIDERQSDIMTDLRAKSAATH